MPKFETVELDDLKKTMGISPQRMKKLQEYLENISRLTPDKACKITWDKGENINTVRNNLKKSAEIAGKNITTRRLGNTIVVYLSERRRAGRRQTRKGA